MLLLLQCMTIFKNTMLKKVSLFVIFNRMIGNTSNFDVIVVYVTQNKYT